MVCGHRRTARPAGFARETDTATRPVIATLPVNATACQFQTMPCMPDGPAGSNKTTCVESAALPPLVPTAITGTFAAGSIWMNTNCSGAPIAAVALHPGSCVSLSSAGLPAFGA